MKTVPGNGSAENVPAFRKVTLREVKLLFSGIMKCQPNQPSCPAGGVGQESTWNPGLVAPM